MAGQTDWGSLLSGGSSSGSSGGPTDWSGLLSGGSSGGSSGPTDWGSLTGASASQQQAPKPKGGGGLLSTVLGGVGSAAQAVKGVAVGVGGTLKDTAELPYVLATEAGKPQAKQDADIQNRIPYLSGFLWGGKAGGSGVAQTIREAGGESILPKDVAAKTVSTGEAYKHPFSAALNDIANVSLVAGPAAGAVSGATEGAEAGSAAARVGTAARGVETAVNPISWPFKGGKALLATQGEKGLATAAAAEEAAKAGVDTAALAKPSALQKLGARFLPEAAQASDIAVTRANKLDAIKQVVGMDAEKADAALRKAGMPDVADSIKQAHEGNLFNGQGQPTEAALPGQGAAAATRTATPTPAAGSFAERQPNFVQGALTPTTPAASTITPAAEAAPAGAKTILPEHAAAAIKDVQAGAAEQMAALPHGDTLAKLLGFNNTQRIDNAFTNALAVTDPVNRALYTAKLGLSPSILVGRLFGHSALALGNENAGGVFQNIGRILGGKVAPEEFEGMSPRVAKNAIVSEKALQATDVEGKTNVFARAAKAIGSINDKSPLPRIAAKMDDTIRRAAYLTERQAGADPELAARNVLKQFGEFDNLSPLERDVMRRIVPFYNWHKQIAVIASHLAEDQPMRAQLMAHLGDLANQSSKQAGLPEGELKVGGHLVDPGFLMPFGEAGTTTKALGLPMASPVAKAAVGLGLHINPNTGKPFSGPKAKVAGVDYAHAGVLENLRKTLPQVNLADALTGRGDVVRYNDGSPVVVGGKTIPTNSNWVDALSSFAGLRSENAQAAQQRQASLNASDQKNAARAKKADAKYKAALQNGG